MNFQISKFPNFQINKKILKYSNKINIISVYLIIGLFGYLSIAPSVKALNMSNSSYILQMGNLNSGSGKPTGSGYKLGITVGQVSPGLYTGTNYKVRAGFQYISSIIKFKFSISDTIVDFGSLTATNPVTRTQTLTINNGSAGGFQVTGNENHQLLTNANGNLIPNTTCDDGLCTTTTSSAWTSLLTYGFGYRCDNSVGTGCATGFSSSNNYKQFADTSLSQAPQAVMTGTNVGKNISSSITYKINISTTQPAGLYTNQIQYIATPTF